MQLLPKWTPTNKKNPAGKGWVRPEKEEGLSVRVRFTYFVGLRTFLALDDFKLDIIAFLQGFVAFGCDGTVMNKNVRSIVASNETEPFGVVKPLHLTFE
jgi:hypothetical protein